MTRSLLIKTSMKEVTSASDLEVSHPAVSRKKVTVTPDL